MRFFVAATLLSLPLMLSGCATIVLLPRLIDQMTEGPSGPTGFEFHRAEGETSGGEPFRIRHFLDPQAGHRFVIALIGGKVFSSRRDDVTRDLEAAQTVFKGAQGRTDAEVSQLFGTPRATSRFEDIRVLWYLRERDEVFALVFRQGRYVTAFRTDRSEMERILDKPSPYAGGGGGYGPSMPWTNRLFAEAR
jgi:hypothetical protein